MDDNTTEFMNNPEQNKELNKDKGFAKCALKIYLQHFLIPERNEILEDLICELDKEGFINTDWIEIY